MKNLLLATALLFLWTLAQGQIAPAPDAARTQAERARIESQRKQELTRYTLEEGVCASKFAVTDCRQANQARQRETMADLRRQEILLNAAERRRKEAQQLARTPKALGEAAGGASSPGSAGSKAPSGERLPHKTQEMAQAQAQHDTSARARAQQQAQKKKRQAEKEASRAAQAQTSAEHQRQYQQKLVDAAQHRADVQAKQQAKGKPPAKPLPDPP